MRNAGTVLNFLVFDDPGDEIADGRFFDVTIGRGFFVQDLASVDAECAFFQ